MKHVKKIFAFAVALFMAFAVVTPAFAAELNEVAQNTAKSITITSPDNASDTNTFTYTVYKVFNATTDGTNISYQAAPGTSIIAADSKFEADSAGVVRYFVLNKDTNKFEENTDPDAKLTGAMIEAIKNYNGKTEVGTVTITGANQSKTVNVGSYGYFFVSTTTGTAVSINSTKPYATVVDKNSLSTVEKTLNESENDANTAAFAEVGTSKPFDAHIHLGKGAKNVVFTDTMTNMTYDGNLVIKVDGDEITGTDKFTATPNSNNDGFTVRFKNEYINTIPEKTIDLYYSGKITANAVTTNQATNKAEVNSGDGNGNKQESDTVTLYNASIKVNKTFQDASPQSLKAGFVLKKTENGSVKYYKFVDGGVTWVDSINDADVRETKPDGTIEAFTGLKDGNYALEEKTVPAGYNKAEDIAFTIVAGNYEEANLNQGGSTTVENKKGTVMPSTGGIGTTIFYIVGGVMVAGAAIFLLTKRRAASAE